MMVPLIALGVLVLALLAAGLWAMGAYNALVAIKNSIDLAWSNMEVLLKQRHDELGKLVEVVKGSRDFEQQTLQKVIEARSAFSAAGSRAQAMAGAAAESAALRGLFAVAEAYPDLKASASCASLQQRISQLEDQVADRREGYNDSVNIFNTRIAQFPDNMLAGFLDYHRHEYFKVEVVDTQDVAIDFH